MIYAADITNLFIILFPTCHHANLTTIFAFSYVIMEKKKKARVKK